jgi:hypothetical protein
MTAITHEPALSFWLDYAEYEGALVEDQGDHALVLLPEPMQRLSELPEEASVTANPDIAREDGAVLLIAGHPAVERAAGMVLAGGDTGNAFAPWPASRPPTRSTLEARARQLVGIEHGRIDAAGEPIPAYLPLLRVGAMVSYAASLTLRFHEQEEAWVDARTGSVASERMAATVRDRTLLPKPDGSARRLAADLSVAIAAAHARLEQRAQAREASLAAHARRTLDSELARASAYYESALESIARRRARAADDRVRLLDAQAEATRAERDRRCREIREEHRPRHELRPFRLHLVHVPAFLLPVDVRRGSRTFGFELIWVPASGEFAGVRCPACGAAEPLVASRERLGCHACTARPAGSQPPARPADSQPAAGAAGANNPPRPRPATRVRASGGPAPRPAAGRRGGGAPERHPRSARPGGHPSGGPTSAERRERTGNKLAFAFWECAANDGRWPRHKMMRDSPLRVLYRLYGPAGPLCAVGIPPDRRVEKMTATTYPGQPGAPELTVGDVSACGESHPYAMFWWLSAGRPVIGEIMPSAHPLALPPPRGETAEVAQRLRERAPTPTVALDPVASLLWRTELENFGLPFAVRCLAAWWRLPHRADPLESHEAVAAAVSRAVTCAGRIKRTLQDAACLYRTEPRLLTLTEHALKDDLRLDPARGW